MTDLSKLSTLDDEIERSLLKARRLFFSSPVDMNSANDAIRKLWYMALADSKKRIFMFINSPGGSVDAGFAIWDQVKMLGVPITTVVTGVAASMGSILSQCADKGQRFATPFSRIMIHQPAIHGGFTAPATDLEIHAKEILKTRDKIVKLYVEATGQERDTVAKAIDRDTWMGPNDAIEFGLLDKVITRFDELPS